MRWIALGMVALLAACGPSPREKAEADKRAVAEVKANQEPPPEILVPEPITFADVEKADLFGAGCNFLPRSLDKGGIALVIAQADEAYFKRDGEIVRLASDAGSKELPYLAHAKYDGLTHSISLELDEEGGKQSGDETIDYPSTLTIRDAQGRPVFTENGTTQCGA